MCKIIFSDIDGTLLDSNQKISFDTKKKIQDLRKKESPLFLPHHVWKAECFLSWRNLE